MAMAISKQLHAILLKRTKSDAKTIVKSAGSGEGLAAWKQLVSDFAPKSASDASALMSLIIAPTRAKNNEDLRSKKVAWEKMVKDYEGAHGTINGPVKVAALKAIIPLELLENRFRGKEKLDFKGLKKDPNT